MLSKSFKSLFEGSLLQKVKWRCTDSLPSAPTPNCRPQLAIPDARRRMLSQLAGWPGDGSGAQGCQFPLVPFVKHIVHLAPFNQVYLCAAWHLLLVTSAETITCPMALDWKDLMYLLCQVGSEKSELEEHVVRRYGPGDGITDCHLFSGCLLHCE